MFKKAMSLFFSIFLTLLMSSDPVNAEMTREELEAIIRQQSAQIAELQIKLKAQNTENLVKVPEADKAAFLQRQWQIEQEYRHRGLERANQAESLKELKKIRRSILYLGN